jgi:hypothetical protein
MANDQRNMDGALTEAELLFGARRLRLGPVGKILVALFVIGFGTWLFWPRYEPPRGDVPLARSLAETLALPLPKKSELTAKDDDGAAVTLPPGGVEELREDIVKRSRGVTGDASTTHWFLVNEEQTLWHYRWTLQGFWPELWPDQHTIVLYGIRKSGWEEVKIDFNGGNGPYGH